MISFARTDLLIIGLSTLTALMAVAGLLFALMQARRNREYDDERKRAEVEIIRRSLEGQVYRLTDRLTSNEARWRDVNHLVVSGQNSAAEITVQNEKQVPHLDFLQRAGITDADFAIDRNSVFVLIPFHPDYEALYFQIQLACRSVGLNCLRGDEQHITGDLLAHIIRMIVKARLIIAVIDGRNPNVFYELGIAHTLSKPVVILSKAAAVEVPFDVQSTRIAFYKDIHQVPSVLNAEFAKLLLSESK